MSKTAMIRARTDPGVKREVETILYKLGMSATEAINIFYRQVKLLKGLPFDVKVPNELTLKAMHDVEEKRSLLSFVQPKVVNSRKQSEKLATTLVMKKPITKSTDAKEMLQKLEH